jgi:hypothetical protein
MTDYSDRVVRATHQVLLEVFQLLEKFHESLILIGGWVPIMIIPDAVEKHVGTIDVDLAINDRTLIETGSETMEEILLSNGYRHGTEPGRYMRQIIIDEQLINVRLTFSLANKVTYQEMNFSILPESVLLPHLVASLVLMLKRKSELRGCFRMGSSIRRKSNPPELWP